MYEILIHSITHTETTQHYAEPKFTIHQQLINDWSAILLCLLCIIFHEYMCRFLLFTEFWCFATRFSGCYEIWLSHRQNNIFVTKHLLAINDTTSE